MSIEDIELVKYRLRRKLNKIENRNTKKGIINWNGEYKLLNDKAYQHGRAILKKLDTIY